MWEASPFSLSQPKPVFAGPGLPATGWTFENGGREGEKGDWKLLIVDVEVEPQQRTQEAVGCSTISTGVPARRQRGEEPRRC